MAGEQFLFSDSLGRKTLAPSAVQTSAGAGDSGKLAQLNAQGQWDNSMVNFAAFENVFAARAATTAALPANTYANGTAGVGATLTADANGALAAQDGVTLVATDTLLVKNESGLENGRYEVTQVGDGSNPFILTRETDYDQDAEINASDLVVIEEGAASAENVFILASNNPITVGTTALNYSALGTTTIIDGDALLFNGITLNVVPGTGMVISSDTIAMDFSTAFNDAKAVAANDLNSTTNGEGSSIIGVEDSAGNFAGTDVEAVLAELAGGTVDGVDYTAGTGGVTKGDLIFISANNEVKPLVISADEFGIGVADSTQVATATVRALANDQLITGVLSGATFGKRQYWNGSAYVETIPTGSQDYIWRGGIAKNATDMQVEVEFQHRNAA